MGHGVADMAHSLTDGAAMHRVLVMLDMRKLAAFFRLRLGISPTADLHTLLLDRQRPISITSPQLTQLIHFEESVIPIWDDYYTLISSLSVLPGHSRKLDFKAFSEVCKRNRQMCHKGLHRNGCLLTGPVWGSNFETPYYHILFQHMAAMQRDFPRLAQVSCQPVEKVFHNTFYSLLSFRVRIEFAC